MPARSFANPDIVYRASEGDKFNADTSLEVVECATCHITYAIPESLASAAQKWPGDAERGWKLCCPLGHTWWYLSTSNTPAVKLQRTQQRLEEERARAGRLAAERDQVRASLSAQKGVTTKLKKRIAAGVCPCCQRTLQNLKRHMDTQHPDFVAEETTTS